MKKIIFGIVWFLVSVVFAAFVVLIFSDFPLSNAEKFFLFAVSILAVVGAKTVNGFGND